MLGNSGGRNKGKKYFIRDKATKDMITNESIQAARNLAKWFENSYKSLFKECRNKANAKFDLDVFHDTYLKMHELVLYTNKEIKDYRAYFCRSYYTNQIQTSIVESRLESFDPLIHQNLEYKESDFNLFEEEYIKLLTKVFREAKQVLSDQDYAIFESFIKWKSEQKKGGSYKDYSKKFNTKLSVIQEIVSRTKKNLVANQKLQHDINYLYNLI